MELSFGIHVPSFHWSYYILCPLRLSFDLVCNFESTLVVLWTTWKLMCLTHFLFHYLPYDFESRDEISFRGKDCNTSGVLNPKICHVIICIIHHFGVSENFDMHSLKQVYFYDNMCWLVWVKSCSKPLYWIRFQNLISSI